MAAVAPASEKLISLQNETIVRSSSASHNMEEILSPVAADAPVAAADETQEEKDQIVEDAEANKITEDLLNDFDPLAKKDLSGVDDTAILETIETLAPK